MYISVPVAPQPSLIFASIDETNKLSVCRARNDVDTFVLQTQNVSVVLKIRELRHTCWIVSISWVSVNPLASTLERKSTIETCSISPSPSSASSISISLSPPGPRPILLVLGRETEAMPFINLKMRETTVRSPSPPSSALSSRLSLLDSISLRASSTSSVFTVSLNLKRASACERRKTASSVRAEVYE
jgi:hypothetical protein